MAFVFAAAGVTSSSSSSWVDSNISVKKRRSQHQQGSPVMLSDYLNSLTKKLAGSGAQAVPAKPASNGYSNGNAGNGVVKPSPSASSSSGKKAPLSYAEYMKLRNGGASGTPPSELAPAPTAPATPAPAPAKPVISSSGSMNYLENLEKKTPGNSAAAPAASSYLDSLTKQSAPNAKQSAVSSAPSSYLESISGKRASNGASASPTPAPAPVTSSSSAPKKTSASSISYEDYMRQRGMKVSPAPVATKPQPGSVTPSKPVPVPAPAAAPSSSKSGSAPLSYEEYMKVRGMTSSTPAASAAMPAAKSAAKPAVSMPGSGNYLDAIEKQSKSSSNYSASSGSSPSSGSSYLDSLANRSAMTAPSSTVSAPSSGSYLDSLTNKQVTMTYSAPAAAPKPVPTSAAAIKPAVPGNTILPPQNKSITVDLTPSKPLNPVESALNQAKSGVMDYLEQFKIEDGSLPKPVETPKQPTRSTTSAFYSTAPAPVSKQDTKSESNPLAPSAAGPMGLESMQSLYILIALWSSGICFAIFFYYLSHPK